jgi:hypothetical protein
MANTLMPVAALQLTTGFQTVYTVPAVTVFTCAVIHIANTTASPITVEICLVPSAGSPTAANALAWDFSIAANDFIEFAKGDIWPAQSTLQAKASAGTSAVLKLSGVETT